MILLVQNLKGRNHWYPKLCLAEKPLVVLVFIHKENQLVNGEQNFDKLTINRKIRQTIQFCASYIQLNAAYPVIFVM